MCQVHAQGLQSKFGREGKSVLLRYLYSDTHCLEEGLPGGLIDKESACQCRRHGFEPWVGNIPGKGNGNPL